MRGTPRAAAYAEENIEVKLNKLLGTFGPQSGKIREGIDSIQSIVTDPDIGSAEGYKTYTRFEFYSILIDLGELRLKEIIEFHLKFLELLKEVGDSINRIATEEVILNLRDEFYDCNEQYKLCLKAAFQESDPDKINLMISLKNENMKDCMNNFNDIKLKAMNFIAIESLRAELSERENEVINDVQRIVTNSDIGSAEGYKTYIDVEFYFMLSELGPSRVREMIERFKIGSEVGIDEVIEVIDRVSLSSLRDELGRACNDYRGLFELDVKRVFNYPTATKVYDEIMDSNWYDTEFAKIKGQAIHFMDYYKLYSELPGEEGFVIQYIRSAVTDPDIDNAKGYKTYTELEFYSILIDLGELRLKEIIKLHLEFLELLEEVGNVIDGIATAEVRRNVKAGLYGCDEQYKLYLKAAFQESDPDKINLMISLKNENMKDCMNRFNDIKLKAMNFIAIEFLRSELSERENEVINDVQRIVTNSDIGRDEGYRTYTELEFREVLGELGPFRVKEMIERFKMGSVADLEALKEVIESMRLGLVGYKLRETCNNYRGLFELDIKRVFNNSTATEVYDEIMDSSWYDAEFAKIKNRVLYFIDYENTYAKLIGKEGFIIKYLQKAATNSDIGKSEGYRTYTELEFREVLGKLGPAKVREMIENISEFLDMLNIILRLIATAKEGQLKVELHRKVLLERNIHYLLKVKECFNKSTVDEIYKAITGDDFLDRVMLFSKECQRRIENQQSN
ncbi:BTA121 domain-containing protein surface lipoprotein [Borrelia hermsii]|uniref:BTA121 domain-containing protein surface lipoprotein n=1 Tax=Borrelia hermsii TaxID=140 RepID=UPI003B8A9000